MTKILVVDDEAIITMQLEERLSSMGYTISGMAASGEEAVEKARRLLPDIVLMDIQLPGINGIEAIRRIKENSPQTQALILSVMNVSDYKEAAIAAGACAYINKQHMHATLIPVLSKLLPSQTTEGDKPLDAAFFTSITDTHTKP